MIFAYLEAPSEKKWGNLTYFNLATFRQKQALSLEDSFSMITLIAFKTISGYNRTLLIYNLFSIETTVTCLEKILQRPNLNLKDSSKSIIKTKH